MATIASMVIQIGADVASLQSQMTKAVSTFDSIDKATQKTSASLVSFSKTSTAVGTAIGNYFGNIASNATMKMVSEIEGMVATGAKLSIVRDAFKGLASAAKQSADGMLAEMRRGTQGMVSDYDLMLAANKAMLLGLPVTAESMGTLSTVALRMGQAMGLGPTQALNDLTTALGRQSSMILDNLGISLKVGEANDRYAKSIGKSSDALTDQEKKLAFYTEALRLAEVKLKELGEASETNVSWMDKAWLKLGNTVSWVTSVFASARDVTEDPPDFKPFKLFDAAAMAFGGTLDEIAKKSTFTAPFSVGLKNTLPPMADAKAKLADFDKQLGMTTEQQLEAANAAAEHAEAVRGLADQFTGRKLAAEIKLSADAIREVGGVSGMTAAEQSKLAKQVGEWLAQGAKVPTVMHDVYRTHEDFNAQAVTSVAKWRELAASAAEYTAKVKDVIPPLEDIKQADLGAILKNSIGNGALKSDELPKTFVQNFGSYLKKGLPDTINAAIIGGGNVFKAAGSSLGSFLVSDQGIGDTLKKGLTSALGKGLGTAASALLPGIGSLMGPLVGAIGSKIMSAFSGGDGRKAVEDFAKSFGGFDALHRKLGELGTAGEQYWIKLTQGVGKNNPQQAKQVIDEITAALAGNQQFLDGLVPDWQEAVDIAAKYGGTVEQLGPKFQQQQLSKQAEDLVVDMKKLQAAGASVNDILSFMGDDIQKVVKHAMQYGLEVPAAMKPVLQTMVDQGLLTDDNGEKLKDLSKIKFSESMTDGFKKIVDKLDELIDRLAGGVPKAAQTAADEAKKKLGELSFEIPVTFKVGGADFAGDRAAAAHSGAMVVANGIRKFHAGAAKILPFGRLASDEVPAILQTGEAVIRRSAVQSLGAGTMAAINRGELPGGAVLDMSGLRADIAALRESQERLALQQGDIIARAVRDGVLMAAVS
jgi:polyhydroxyalkanoate synthesis regulator phasin